MDKRRNPRRLQYQIKTEAPSAFIKTVPLFQWRSPLSEPVWIKRGLATHLQSFIVSEPFGPPKESIPKVYRWFAPLSEPVRTKPRLLRSLQDVSAEVYLPPVSTVTVDMWLAPLAEPVRAVRPVHKVNLFPFTAASAAAAVAIDWLTPLSEPVRIARAPQKLYPLPFTAQAASQQTVDIGWFAPLAEPIRVRTSPAQQQVLAFAPNPIVPTGWAAPLSVPTRAKQQAIADYAYAPLAISEVVTIDKWFNPLADPAKKAGLRTSSQQSYFATQFIDQNAIALNTRFNQLIEPIRARARPTESPALFFVATTTETITVDKWFAPFLDPARKAGLGTGSQQALAFVATVVAAPAPPQSWFAPLTDPVRRIPAAQKVNLFPFTAAAVVQPTVDIGWFTPLTDPVRKVPAAQKQYPLSFTAAAVVTVETVTVDKWFVSFTNPVRVKPGLATALQQSLAFVKAAPFPETVTESRWHQPLSEPLRSKPGISAANQAAFFAPSTVITSETITVDKWFEQLSNPTRRKPEERDHYKGENEFTAIAASMKWFAPLTEPVRQKIGLRTNQQQALAYVVTIASTEVVTVDKWFVSFQDPVRVKPALLTGRQQFLTWPTLIIIPSLASWWRPLAEPPKPKAGLSVHLQPTKTEDPKLFPNPSRFLEGWFNWLSEPVRKLPQLSVALQKAWFGPDRNAVQATVTVTMAVTEVNADAALFAIKVYASNPPATAVVSLVEIGHGASLTSIVEEGDDGSGTSIVEN